jgi:hypothetical protein
VSTGLKANSDGSAAIQVGGSDVITLTSGGAATFLTSPTTVQAGTAAAPSITFSGDTNTGIYSPGADTVGLTAGGTLVGSVGLGTTLALQGATSQSGTGIAFPATQSASSDANTLDDYEEGTWTPAISYQNATDNANATETAQTGHYTKIGRLVMAAFRLTWTQASASPVNDNVSLTGLPFAAGTQSTNLYGPSAVLENTVKNYVYTADHPTSGSSTSLISAPMLSGGYAAGNVGNELGTGSITIGGVLMYFTS